jgi:hypothetical protein
LLTIEFEKTLKEEDQSPVGELQFAGGHVNIELGQKQFDETGY